MPWIDRDDHSDTGLSETELEIVMLRYPMAPESVEEGVLIAINRIGNGSLIGLLSIRGNVVEGKLKFLSLLGGGTDRLDRRGGAGYGRRSALVER